MNRRVTIRTKRERVLRDTFDARQHEAQLIRVLTEHATVLQRALGEVPEHSLGLADIDLQPLYEALQTITPRLDRSRVIYEKFFENLTGILTHGAFDSETLANASEDHPDTH